MIPIWDNLENKGKPWVTYGLVGLNVCVYVAQVAMHDWGVASSLNSHWVPTAGKFALAWQEGAPHLLMEVVASLFLYMFLHHGLLHLAFNMTYIVVLGPALEAEMGRARFVLFWICSGLAAGLYFGGPEAEVGARVMGASGVGAAMIGAYLVLWPRARFTALAPWPVTTNSFFLLAAFAVTQLLGVWSQATGELSDGTNVSYWGHTVGFSVGFVIGLIMVWRRRGRRCVTVPPCQNELYDDILDGLQHAGGAAASWLGEPFGLVNKQRR